MLRKTGVVFFVMIFTGVVSSQAFANSSEVDDVIALKERAQEIHQTGALSAVEHNKQEDEKFGKAALAVGIPCDVLMAMLIKNGWMSGAPSGKQFVALFGTVSCAGLTLAGLGSLNYGTQPPNKEDLEAIRYNVYSTVGKYLRERFGDDRVWQFERALESHGTGAVDIKRDFPDILQALQEQTKDPKVVKEINQKGNLLLLPVPNGPHVVQGATSEHGGGM